MSKLNNIYEVIDMLAGFTLVQKDLIKDIVKRVKGDEIKFLKSLFPEGYYEHDNESFKKEFTKIQVRIKELLKSLGEKE